MRFERATIAILLFFFLVAGVLTAQTSADQRLAPGASRVTSAPVGKMAGQSRRTGGSLSHQTPVPVLHRPMRAADLVWV